MDENIWYGDIDGIYVSMYNLHTYIYVCIPMMWDGIYSVGYYVTTWNGLLSIPAIWAKIHKSNYFEVNRSVAGRVPMWVDVREKMEAITLW